MAKVTAISSLAWAHYTLYQALQRMAARGFERIEIASFFSYCFHFNFGSPTPNELRSLLDEYGLQPVCLNYCEGYYDAWDVAQIDLFVERMTRKIEQLATVGIPMLTMHFGLRNERDDQEQQLANAVKAYDRVADIAAAHGVRTLLEVPHLYGLMPRIEQVLWVFERLESRNIGAVVDTSHWGIIGYDVDSFLEALGDRLWHVHLRDSAGPDTADRKQALEITPGKGTVNFAQFAAALDRVGYKGDVSIEFEYRDMPFDAIDRELDRGLRHLSNHGWELPDRLST